MILMVMLLASCSSLRQKAGNCLDDDSCDDVSTIEEELSRGVWYCYGVSRNELWDCSQQEDKSKIAVIPEALEAPSAPDDDEEDSAESIDDLAGVAPPPGDEDDGTAPPEPTDETTASPPLEGDDAGPDFTGPPASEQTPVVRTIEETLLQEEFEDSDFVVQLIALSSFEEVRLFITSHELDPASVVQTQSMGHDRYNVILGIYPDRLAAEEAADAWLNGRELDLELWIRPAASIRAVMTGTDY